MAHPGWSAPAAQTNNKFGGGGDSVPSDHAHPLTVYALLLAVGVTGGVGDIFLNKWAKSHGSGWLLASYALWLASVTLLGYFLRWERFAFGAAIVLAMVIHVSIALACDLIYFGGRLSRLEWLGVAFAVVAVVLLEAGREKTDDHPPDRPAAKNEQPNP